MKQTILIVEDELSIVKLLQYNLENAGFHTDVAFNGKEALQKCEEKLYDLIILDLMLPKVDGMKVCHHLRKNKNDTPILMLTAKSEESEKISGLEIGADDYLTKPFSPKEVIARIRAILRRTGERATTKKIKIGDLFIYPQRYEAKINGRSLTFTRKEFELLRYLAQHLGEVLTRDQLLLAVWDYEFAGNTRIVDVHISHLRDKIEKNKRNPQYIKTIRGLGYKMEEPTA